LPSPGPADASATPNTATRPEEGGCERQTTTAAAHAPATPPVKPSPLTPQNASALASPAPPCPELMRRRVPIHRIRPPAVMLG
jgi:hypothetical protein